MFYHHEFAESHFRSINGRPEFKIIVPQGATTKLSMMIQEKDEVPFCFPNPKPAFNELFAENSKWTPYRISFTNSGILIVFKNREIELNPEDADIDIYDTRDFAISRPYSSFVPSSSSITFYINIIDANNEPTEAYTILVDNNIVTITTDRQSSSFNTKARTFARAKL